MKLLSSAQQKGKGNGSIIIRPKDPTGNMHRTLTEVTKEELGFGLS